MSDKCTSCGAAIFFAVSPNKQRVPIDAEPVADGNVIVMQSRTSLEAKTCVVLARDAERPKGRRLFMSHFATCPEASKHRKRKGARA